MSPITPVSPPASLPASARTKPHPMLLTAAVAVILFCLVGMAAILGWIPSSIGSNSSADRNSSADLNSSAERSSSAADTGKPMSEFDRAKLASRLAEGDAGAINKPLPVTEVRAGAAARTTSSHAGTARIEREYHFASGEATLPRPQRKAPPVQLAAADSAPARHQCTNCGNVESVREITQRGQGSGLGAAGGAVLGGLLGNQIGGGHGKQLATVAGAIGGAVVGNQVEGRMKATRSYEIKVRLDDGRTRSFNQQSAAGWHAGDRVKIVNGALRSAS